MSNKHKTSTGGFGAHGWGIILFCLLLFFFYGSFVTDGINITKTYLAEQLGVQGGTVVSMNTVAGVTGVIFYIFMGQLNHRIGPRKAGGICLIIGALAYMVTGNTSSILVYTVAMCFVTGTIMSATYIVGGTLTARWFPKKKGIVMGYTTCGLCFSAAFYTRLLNILITNLGFGKALVIPAAVALLLGLVCLVYVRDFPQERGLNPDNVSDEIYHAEYCEEHESESPWTTGKLLRTRETWFAAICSAIPTFCTVGVMSQLIPRNMSLGMSMDTALNIMLVLSLVSIPGSILVGMIDTRLGTKTAMTIYTLWYMLALFLNFTEKTPLVYLSLVMFCITTGGGGNFTVSLPTSVFGRHGYDKVNSVIFPIQGVITALNYSVNGIITNITGSVRYSYVVFMILCALNIILLRLFDDKKFNKDFAAERTEAN